MTASIPLPADASGSGSHPIRAVLRSPAAVLGAVWLAGLAIASVTAPLWLPYPPAEQDFTQVLALPSAAHPLGTDELGRDVLSRLFTAAGETLAVTMVTAAVALGIALPLALWAAAAPRAGAVADRVTEVVMAIPALVVMLAVVGAYGPELLRIMTILGVLISGGIYRVLVGQARALQAQPYVDAARIDGRHPVLISIRHILPNMLSTVFVQFALVFAVALLIQAGLAFLGFGPAIPAPTWGGMIQAASQRVYDAPFLMVPTGLMLALTVLAANTLADTVAAAAGMPAALVPLRPRRRPAVVAPSGASPEPADELVVRGLTVAVDGGPELITEVSLRVQAGHVLGIVGESGCGKTVTALSLIGLLNPGLAPRAGSIMWRGRDLAQLSDHEFAKLRGREIAYISQEPMRALDPMFSVGSQLRSALRRLGGLNRAEARASAVELLALVGIEDAERVVRLHPHQISGGMAQRVAIALALAGRPKLIIADEPTTALDVTVQAEILGLLRELVTESGTTLVLVTHDLGVVADICDDVAVMYAGQVVENGPVREVLRTPQHPYTMALLASDPHSARDGRRRLPTIPGKVPAPEHWQSGCRFAERCRFATEACTFSPVASMPREGQSGEVRCVRAGELVTAGRRWEEPDVETPAARRPRKARTAR